jgi:glycosyltransferase involved in cell wall biosynthesis
MCRASIIVPAYNADAYIEQTLRSILQQDYSDFEVLVINDGSTDNTEVKVKIMAQQDARIKYIAQPNSGGPAKPRNAGIARAKGDYIFIFDADDLMLEGKLAQSIKYLDQFPEADLLFTNFSTIDESGHVLKQNFLDEYDTLWDLVGGREVDYCFLAPNKVSPALIKINFIGTSGVAIRRKALEEQDRFNESLRNSDDRLFWMLFSMQHNFIFLNQILHQYRILPGSISNQGFIRRGPSKIQALKIVMARVKDKSLKTHLSKQIASDYASLAYGFKQKGDFKNQQKNAWYSLQYALNLKAIKLLIVAVFNRTVNKVL